MKKVLVLSTAILLTTTCFAVDGVVLINQASIMASGGFPYKILQSGSYKLSGNLVVSDAATDAIDINVDNVTLDLNGFTISGSGSCKGTTVSCNGTSGNGVVSSNDNITVRNGSVAGMAGSGIALNGLGGLIEEVHTKFDSTGMFCQFCIVRRNSGVSNGIGIIVFSGVVEANFAGKNQLGILATNSTVIGNTLLQNASEGMRISKTVFGSNSLQFNGNPFLDFGGSTTQNNNNCDGSTC